MSVTLNEYKIAVLSLIEESRNSINRKYNECEAKDNKLTRKIKKNEKKYKKDKINPKETDIYKSIEFMRQQIKAIRNSKYNLIFIKSEIKFSYTKEHIDSVIDKETEVLEYLSSKYKILTEKFLEQYKNKFDKLKNKNIHPEGFKRTWLDYFTGREPTYKDEYEFSYPIGC